MSRSTKTWNTVAAQCAKGGSLRRPKTAHWEGARSKVGQVCSVAAWQTAVGSSGPQAAHWEEVRPVVRFQKEILNVASVQFGVAKRSEQLYPVETATVTDSVSIRPKGRME